MSYGLLRVGKGVCLLQQGQHGSGQRPLRVAEEDGGEMRDTWSSEIVRRQYTPWRGSFGKVQIETREHMGKDAESPHQLHCGGRRSIWKHLPQLVPYSALGGGTMRAMLNMCTRVLRGVSDIAWHVCQGTKWLHTRKDRLSARACSSASMFASMFTSTCTRWGAIHLGGRPPCDGMHVTPQPCLDQW